MECLKIKPKRCIVMFLKPINLSFAMFRYVICNTYTCYIKYERTK